MFKIKNLSQNCFSGWLVDEGLEQLTEIEPPCQKQEYTNFIESQIAPTTCTSFKIYQFQAEVLKLIFENPALIERIEIEYGFNRFSQ